MARGVNSFVRLGHGIYRFSRGGGGGREAVPTTIKGPRVTVVGGVHGNERIGVLVLDALRLALLHATTPAGSTAAPLITDGASITLVYANQHALRIGKRGATPHADMNRCFTSEILSGADENRAAQYEEMRARELAPIFAQSDVMIDLHSTNKPSPPFIRIAGHARGGLSPWMARLAARLPCSILLHDPHFLLADGRVALTDEYVGANGGLGICFESGVATDLSQHKVDSITRSLWTILTTDTHAVEEPVGQQQLPNKDETQTTATTTSAGFEEVYEITQVFKLTQAGFRWADGVGDTNFQRVEARQPIGFVGSEPFTVDYESFIVFPKVPELWKLGAPLGWLTKKKNKI